MHIRWAEVITSFHNALREVSLSDNFASLLFQRPDDVSGSKLQSLCKAGTDATKCSTRMLMAQAERRALLWLRGHSVN